MTVGVVIVMMVVVAVFVIVTVRSAATDCTVTRLAQCGVAGYTTGSVDSLRLPAAGRRNTRGVEL